MNPCRWFLDNGAQHIAYGPEFFIDSVAFDDSFEVQAAREEHLEATGQRTFLNSKSVWCAKTCRSEFSGGVAFCGHRGAGGALYWAQFSSF